MNQQDEQQDDWMEYDVWECTHCHTTNSLQSDESIYTGSTKCCKCGGLIWVMTKTADRFCLLIWNEMLL